MSHHGSACRHGLRERFCASDEDDVRLHTVGRRRLRFHGGRIGLLPGVQKHDGVWSGVSHPTRGVQWGRVHIRRRPRCHSSQASRAKLRQKFHRQSLQSSRNVRRVDWALRMALRTMCGATGWVLHARLATLFTMLATAAARDVQATRRRVQAHGSCLQGQCYCNDGFIGPACEYLCRGFGSACSGHGVCYGTGNCSCHSDTQLGFWQAPDCATCVDGYSGSNCNRLCPTNGSHVCSAHGLCVDGICQCDQPYCGASCSTYGASCLLCPKGRYGGGCELECPGGANTSCNNHGACSEGVLGTGLCTCQKGYGGSDCSQICPGGADTPCSGNGVCSSVTMTCSCAPFFSHRSLRHCLSGLPQQRV